MVTERRIHAVVAVIARDIVGGDCKVVGRGFTGDRQALSTRGADGRHRIGARDVLDVRGATGFAAEPDIAQHGLDLGFGREERQPQLTRNRTVTDHAVFGNRRYDRMIHDRLAEPLGARHRFAHDRIVGDHCAVIGKGGGTGGGEGIEVGDFHVPADPE